MKDKISIPEIGFMRLPEIIKIFPVGRSSWWKGVKDGKYPQPVKLGPNTTAWRAEDIRALLENAGKQDEVASE